MQTFRSLPESLEEVESENGAGAQTLPQGNKPGLTSPSTRVCVCACMHTHIHTHTSSPQRRVMDRQRNCPLQRASYPTGQGGLHLEGTSCQGPHPEVVNKGPL